MVEICLWLMFSNTETESAILYRLAVLNADAASDDG